MQPRLASGILFAVAAFAQTPSPSGIELGSMDRSVSPCTNFYQYACGNWRAHNPIPSDQSRWSRFNELYERNQKIARDILEKSAAAAPSRSAVEREIGDYYASCMDEKTVESKGITPIRAKLDSVAALASKDGLPAEIARLQNGGTPGIFRFFPEPDPKQAGTNIAFFAQGGLGLPDRDYYLKTDARSEEIRTKYRAHIARMFDLLSQAAGQPASNSAARAQSVLDFEIAMARVSMDRTLMRDPDNTFHPMAADDLARLAPSFDWKVYISGLQTPAIAKINVSQPEFFKGLDALIRDTPLPTLQAYLDWHILHTAAPALSHAFVDENFDFFEKTLAGVKEIQPRWKRCTADTDRALGEALGQKFVEVAFSGPSKARALRMVDEIEKAMASDIQTATWMSDATKKQAMLKLGAVANKIGFPEKWRDYSSVTIARDDYLGNRERAYAFELHRNLNKIGQPVDKTEWGMTPPTVNAYYSPPENNINFPAGILQPPFYNAKVDDSVNYGAIGVVVGHELTHGFDDHGRRYDGDGNLRDWWTPVDAKNFTSRAECVVNEYASFSPVDGVKLNGKLTLGENAADNGGMHLAYMALMDSLAGKTLPKRDGYTPQQLFFLGYAQIWCENITDQSARVRAVTDPHSPGQFRVNGTIQNMREFQEAWSCKAGDPMVRPEACRVW